MSKRKATWRKFFTRLYQQPLGNREVVKHVKLLKSNIDYGLFLPIQIFVRMALVQTADTMKQIAAQIKSSIKL